jgi:PAS domain S-box-containing protein
MTRHETPFVAESLIGGTTLVRHGQALLVAIAIAAVLGALSLQIAVESTSAGPLWIVTAVLTAGLIRFDALPRPTVLIGAALGSVIAYVLRGTPALATSILAAANVAIIAGGVAVFDRLRPHPRSLIAPASIGMLLVVALLAPIPAVLVASMVEALRPGAWPWWQWYTASSLGLVILGPFVVAGGCRDCLALARSRRMLEIVAVVLGAGAVALFVFSQGRFPILFLPFPAITAAVFRLRFIGAAASTATIAAVAGMQTAAGHGPIAAWLTDASEQLLFLQAYLAVVVVAAMPVAAILVEREQLAREIVDSEERFRTMASTAPVAMFRADATGRIRYQNESWSEMIGDFLGRPWIEVAAIEMRAELTAAWQRSLAAGYKLTGDYDFLRRGGDVGWVSLALEAERAKDGTVLAFVGIAVDVEERRSSAQRIERSERDFRLLAESTNDMVVRLGLDGVRRYVSPACRTILGYEPEELVGETPVAAIHAEDRARVERVCRELLAGAQDPVCSYRQRRRDGTYAWLEATYRLLRNEQGEPVEFIASVRDIGRRRSAELEATSALARLEESHRLLQMAEGLAGVGHWRLDAETLDVFWSDEVYRIHGREVGDTPPLDQAIQVYHEDDRAAVQGLVNAALTEGTGWTFKARIFRPNGELRHVESSGRAERPTDAWSA